MSCLEIKMTPDDLGPFMVYMDQYSSAISVHMDTSRHPNEVWVSLKSIGGDSADAENQAVLQSYDIAYAFLAGRRSKTP